VRDYINQWLTQLGDANATVGLPMVILGLGMMFMGWQFCRATIPMTFFLVGMICATMLVKDPSVRWIIGGVAGLCAAGLSALNMRISVGLLGGMSGTFLLSGYLSLFESLVLPPIAEYAVAIFGFVAGAAMSFVLHRETTIVVTSLAGSLLLVCGMNPVLSMAVPRLHGTVSAFLSDYPGLFAPFVLGGPMLIASLIQMAQANLSNTSERPASASSAAPQ
jgi:hypothetical protein